MRSPRRWRATSPRTKTSSSRPKHASETGVEPGPMPPLSRAPLTLVRWAESQAVDPVQRTCAYPSGELLLTYLEGYERWENVDRGACQGPVEERHRPGDRDGSRGAGFDLRRWGSRRWAPRRRYL